MFPQLERDKLFSRNPVRAFYLFPVKVIETVWLGDFKQELFYRWWAREAPIMKCSHFIFGVLLGTWSHLSYPLTHCSRRETKYNTKWEAKYLCFCSLLTCCGVASCSQLSCILQLVSST
uniref:Uncharacterized protein n=1 Tax=Cacopsylla melanoneura TaxID=428564 RepID=A0A8D8SJA4_9HEMI